MEDDLANLGVDVYPGKVDALIAEFWSLAEAAGETLSNGMAIVHMCQVLEELSGVTDGWPIGILRRLRKSSVLESLMEGDSRSINAACRAEALWMQTYMRPENRQYFPPGYVEERDRFDDALQTSKLAVGDAGEIGKGLYARDAIAKGEIVFVSSGKRIYLPRPYESQEIVPGSSEGASGYSVKPRNPDKLNPNAICIGQRDLSTLIDLGIHNPPVPMNVWLDPFPVCPLRFLNHSCDPSLMRVMDGVMFVAMREIEPGEQLTCDYATLEINPDWEMECKCGSANCRGQIRGIQSLSAELFEKYGASLPRFMFLLFAGAHSQISPEVFSKLSMTRWLLSGAVDGN